MRGDAHLSLVKRLVTFTSQTEGCFYLYRLNLLILCCAQRLQRASTVVRLWLDVNKCA